jgi:glycosyltransferase involved in cell wall biosynthesis
VAVVTSVAVLHEWLTDWGGSEQVAAAIAEVVEAPAVHTAVSDPAIAARAFPASPVVEVSGIARSRWAKSRREWLIPEFARAWARFDTSGYELVITSSHCCTNAVRVQRPTVHMSYCHTPMRYAWNWRAEAERAPLWLRPALPSLAAVLRRADNRWAQKVDLFVANSHNVAERVRRYYGRESLVLHPPIDTSFWTPGGSKGDHFLIAGRFVSYKRPLIALRAARAAGVRVVVAGAGSLLAQMKDESAGDPNVDFVSVPSDEELRDQYRSASALLFAGDEDFGMTLVEAQACGTPVIAWDRGGAKEAVISGKTGLLVDDGSVSGLAEAIKGFDPGHHDAADMRANAERFDRSLFKKRFRALVAAVMSDVSVGVPPMDDLAKRLEKDL